ncbi:hypothetical protein AB6A40_011092 [Gnathostoma spinigerum]|uniref:Ubiquitin-like domain-containing protein n=1 Tax=Gnathostoma spinigerum TaxID=75299 RepID=A0ABD6EWP4_9BILA
MPSSDEDLSSFRVGFPSHAGTSSEMLNIRICSVTGQDWTEIVSPIETVEGLKLKIWKRSGLLPCYQRLIFSGENLSSHNNLRHLRDYGIQQDSLIRLMLAPRSGPLHVLTHVPKETSKIVNKSDVERCPVDESYCNKEFEFDEECLKENQRTLYKMCDLRRAMKQNNPITKCVSSFHEKRMISAPEDTSAKESSAGETEFDDDSCGYSGLSLKSDLALSAVSIKNGRRNRQSGSKGYLFSCRCTSLQEQCCFSL